MHAVRNLIGVSVVGIVGIVIVMAIAIGTNVTGWSGTMTSMVQTIIPIVMGAAVIMVMLYASMGSGSGKGL